MVQGRQSADHVLLAAAVYREAACLALTTLSFGSMTPQVFDNFENAVAGLGDVHVHSGVMLSGHHFSRTTRPMYWTGPSLTGLRKPKIADDLDPLADALYRVSDSDSPPLGVSA